MKKLITSAQDFTASWVDLGSPVKAATNEWLGLWLNIDINNTLNARVRALGLLNADGDIFSGAEFSLAIKTTTASVVSVEDEYYEFTDDADQKILLMTQLEKVVPYVQFQIQAGTVGATAGQIDNAYVTFSNL